MHFRHFHMVILYSENYLLDSIDSWNVLISCLQTICVSEYLASWHRSWADDHESSRFNLSVMPMSRVTPDTVVDIGSGNDLSPERHQAIIWTNADLLPIRPPATLLMKFKLEIESFIQENAFEMVVCKLAAILFRPRSVPNSDVEVVSGARLSSHICALDYCLV